MGDVGARLVKATAEPAYLAEAEKLGVDASALDGEEVKRIILAMKQTPKAVIRRYKEALANGAR